MEDEKVLELEKTIEKLKKHLSSLTYAEYTFDDIVSVSEAMSRAKNRALNFATTDLTILLTGMRGTGKNLFASAIHKSSNRQGEPFIVFNANFVPDYLIDTELFGFEKDSFVGANIEKLGKFELAEGGTLFLDEIGALSLNTQGKILDILNKGYFRRIGSEEDISVNVRLIAATNENLEEKVKNGEFNKELYDKLDGVCIEIPDLSKRKEDIPELATKLISKFNVEYGEDFVITEEFIKSLQDRVWKNNVVDLQNYLSRYILLGEKEANALPEIKIYDYATNDTNSISDVEKAMIFDALEKYGYDTKGKQMAAKALKISLATLYNKLRSYQ